MNAVNKNKKLLFSLAFAGLVLAIIATIVSVIGWEQIKALAARISSLQLLILLALSLINYFARALRWRLYTRALKLSTTTMQDFRHYLGGFALTLTPGRLGELIRLRWINKETGTPLNRVAPLMLADRAADLIVVALLLGLSASLSAGGIAGAFPVVIAALIVAILVTRPSLLVWGVTKAWKWLGKFPRFFAGSRKAARQMQVFSKPVLILPALILGGLGWFAEGYAFYLLLGWLGAEIDLWLATAIFLFAMLGGGATGLPGGLGGAEAALVALLLVADIPLDISLVATTIIRITTLWFAIGIGICVFPFAESYARKGQ